MNETEMF